MHTSHQTTNSPKTTKSAPTQINRKHIQTLNKFFLEELGWREHYIQRKEGESSTHKERKARKVCTNKG